MSYSCFVDFNETLDTILHDKLWECLQWLGVPLHLQLIVKAMYIILYAKVQINDDTHDEVMSDIGVKKWCLLPHTLINLYVDDFETYLDEINKFFMYI